jgi:hypothetical protein
MSIFVFHRSEIVYTREASEEMNQPPFVPVSIVKQSLMRPGPICIHFPICVMYMMRSSTRGNVRDCFYRLHHIKKNTQELIMNMLTFLAQIYIREM